MSITGATNKFNIKICKIGEIKKMIDKRRKSAPSKGINAKNPDFGGLQTTKAQTSLRIRAV